MRESGSAQDWLAAESLEEVLGLKLIIIPSLLYFSLKSILGGLVGEGTGRKYGKGIVLTMGNVKKIVLGSVQKAQFPGEGDGTGAVADSQFAVDV